MADSDRAKRIYKKIKEKKSRPWQGEEEVRIAYVSAIENELHIHFDAERIRKDSSYNNVIIEFKSPGSFKGNKYSAKFIEATEERLLPYIIKESKKTKIPQEDFIGIAIDGEHICFAQVIKEKIYTQTLLAFTPISINYIIQAVIADTKKAITTDNLLRDFGHGSRNAKFLMQTLSDGLASKLKIPGNSKVKMLYEEWKTLYGQVSDMSILQIEKIEAELSFQWNGEKEDVMSGRLFVIHTYNSLLIKLLAAEIVSGHGLSAILNPAESIVAIEDDLEMMDQLLAKIEHASIFAQAGIKGFVEEAIFSWYHDLKENSLQGEQLSEGIRNILISVSLYRSDRLNHTRDVLRDLYQSLIPGRLRQSLGEFYTPDWLVDWTVKRIGHEGWYNKRVLDPTCGSGAFLIRVLQLKSQEGIKMNKSSQEIVESLCSTTWGFDLNPLAVQTSRVNFLMEIAFLLKDCPGIEIEIPILLADAIYSPAKNPENGEGVVTYQIGSQVAGLDIHLPAPLAFDRSRLDAVFDLMGENVEENLPYKQNSDKLLEANLLSESESIEWAKPLQKTYDQILNLHSKQWNGIWFRIVRNFFWSATAGKFDILIGNPPWVRWSKLPELYRERVKPTCESYGIFSDNKRHGGNELDISAMIVYTTADKWLKDQGLLAFVITGTLFKNPSSAGFRKLQIGKEIHLKPHSVDDLKILKPFPDASNHTTIMVLSKGSKEESFPVTYNIWNTKKGISRKIPSDYTIEQVEEIVEILQLEAAPVGTKGSPWAVLKKGRFEILKYLSGKSVTYEGRKGITTDLNGVFFVPIIQQNNSFVQIRSRPEAGRKKIGVTRNAWVEPDLLFPLVKGAGDFESCYLKLEDEKEEDKLYTFLPNQGILKQDYKRAEKTMNDPSLAKTKRWFKNFKPVLEKRSTYRRQMKGAPYYAVYNIGDYTLKPWKVIWPEMSSKFYAAVVSYAEVPLVGKRPYIPDHKIYYCSFDNKSPAYFLCGLLNCDSVKEWIESHNISIQVGNIFKHLELPPYNPHNDLHKALVDLVEKIHKEKNKENRESALGNANLLSESILLQVK